MLMHANCILFCQHVSQHSAKIESQMCDKTSEEFIKCQLMTTLEGDK